MGQSFYVLLLCLSYLSCRCQSSPFEPCDINNELPNLLRRGESLDSDSSATHPLRKQFIHPAEVLGILLIIGGDVIQKAIAQLAGRRVAPVAFSFGWVSYSFGALLSVWGEGRLLPLPDCASVVIHPNSGNLKRNESWVIGRLIRDLELHYNKQTDLGGDAFRIIKLEAKNVWLKQLKRRGEDIPDPPHHDKVWWSFLLCAIGQFGLAITPLFINHSGNWRILLVTSAGTALALIHGSLPQWREEKYACGKKIASLSPGGTATSMSF